MSDVVKFEKPPLNEHSQASTYFRKRYANKEGIIATETAPIFSAAKAYQPDCKCLKVDKILGTPITDIYRIHDVHYFREIYTKLHSVGLTDFWERFTTFYTDYHLAKETKMALHGEQIGGNENEDMIQIQHLISIFALCSGMVLISMILFCVEIRHFIIEFVLKLYYFIKHTILILSLRTKYIYQSTRKVFKFIRLRISTYLQLIAKYK